MMIANHSVNTHVAARVFRRRGLGFKSALLLLILLTAVSSASAAITFDNANASKAKHNTSEISWKHTIGGGADRALVVAVCFRDFSINNNRIAAVKLGSVAMRPAPDSLARSSGWRVQTKQLFYLNGGEMPAPGTYDVSVTFTGKVDQAAGGAVSLFGVEPGAPAAAATNANIFGLGQISTYVNNTQALAAKDLRNARVAAMSSTNAAKLAGSSGYSFDVTLNGAISTEGSAVLIEKSQIVDVLSPMRNNQVSASQPEYTGKILALDTLYQRRGVIFRGDSTTPGSPLASVPAPELEFSWNGFAALPYSYTTHDPSQLPSLLTNSDGAGAGSLYWPKENWLKTTY